MIDLPDTSVGMGIPPICTARTNESCRNRGLPFDLMPDTRAHTTVNNIMIRTTISGLSFPDKASEARQFVETKHFDVFFAAVRPAIPPIEP